MESQFNLSHRVQRVVAIMSTPHQPHITALTTFYSLLALLRYIPADAIIYPPRAATPMTIPRQHVTLVSTTMLSPSCVSCLTFQKTLRIILLRRKRGRDRA
jgi:hypothetical protein